MANRKLDDIRALARADYLNSDSITQAALAKKYGVSRPTIANWADKENWRGLKAAKIVSMSKSVNNAYKLLDSLMQKAVDMAEKGEETAKVVNEISQINKTIEGLTGELPLDTIINVVDEFLDFIPHGQKTKDFRSDRELVAKYQSEFLIARAKKMSIT